MNKKCLYPKLLCLLVLFLYVTAARAQSNGLEYWFDSYSNPKTIGMPVAAGTLKSNINVKSLEQGFHTIYMRVKSSDGTYSPITSSTFIKFNASGDSKLEYWFDDNVSKRVSTPIDIASDVVQLMDLDLSNDALFPLGFHQLNLRVAAYGGHYSPVYSSFVMKLPAGLATEITYWLDENYKGRRVVRGIPVNATTTLFNTSLDFSSASVGMHRFKYRITSRGFDNGVIYEVPLLITKRYNNVGEATIVGESHWIDDVSPMEYAVSNPQSIITKIYTLAPSVYSIGQHAFHVQYKNSADVWSEQNITYFYKEESGKLRIGIMPTVVDGIEDSRQPERMSCVYHDGTIIIDCQSARLASEGTLLVCDLTGKVIARENVKNADGIHVEVNVPDKVRQILVVRLISGNVNFTKKLVVQ